MGRRIFGLFGPRETLNERLLREARPDGTGSDPEPAGSDPATTPDFEPPGSDPEPPGSDPAAAQPPAGLPPAWLTDGAPQVRAVPFLSLERHALEQWQPLASAVAPELTGPEICFYALEDGSVIVEEQEGDAPLDPLLDALEGQIDLPYRGRAIAHGGALWSIAAEPIGVVELPGVEADDFGVGVYRGELVVDGEPAADPAAYRPVEELAARQGLTDYAGDATRLEDATFALVLRPL